MRGWHDLPPAPEGPLRMSRVVVIGATGNIGSYLVPRLVRGGDEVIAMSRGVRGLYHASPQWKSVTRVRVDREAQDAEGTFGAQVAALRPDVVIDLVCFTAASARQLVDALRPSRPLLIHCGTIWVHGPALRVPVTEDEPRTAYGEYGTGKAEIEALLHRETLAGGLPAVVLHPGHISGAGGGRARLGHPRTHDAQHQREHRPGQGGARVRAAVQHAGRPARGADLAGRQRPGRRRRPGVLSGRQNARTAAAWLTATECVTHPGPSSRCSRKPVASAT